MCRRCGRRRARAQSGSIPVCAGQAVVDVDPVIADAERGKAVALPGQILVFGGHPRVAHQKLVHHPGLPDGASTCQSRRRRNNFTQSAP